MANENEALEAEQAARSALERKWKKRIEDREPAYKEYWSRAEKVVKRYEDERNRERNYTAGQSAKLRRYNILWSNTETLRPILYNKRPDPVVKRRWSADEPVARTSAELLERCVTFNADRDKVYFSDHMGAAVFNLLVPGTGAVWARYEPTMTVIGEDENGKPLESVGDQCVYADYVHYRDLMAAEANVWSQVEWLARILWWTPDKVAERWGVEGAQKCSPQRKDTESGDANQSRGQMCKIYEIWDKESRQVIFMTNGQVLETETDPLGLACFFPCPEPLFGCWSTEDIIPTPLYCQYQDQAQQLDDVTTQIYTLVRACKVVGVYNEGMGADFQQMLTNTDNTMVPVTDWPAFQQGGAMQGNVDTLDLRQVVEMLQALLVAEESIKKDLNEITGMPDLFRGISSPLDAEGTNQLKVQWGASRMRDMQRDVQRFARDWMVLSAEIISEHFTPQNLMGMSGMNLPTGQEKAAIQMQLQQMEQQAAMQAQLTGQPPQMPDIPDELTERLESPTIEEVVQVLRSDKFRTLMLDIESDSTVEGDDAKDREDRGQFVEILTGMIERWGPIVAQAPQMLPLAKELILFAIQPFRAGRGLEDEVERTFDILEKQAKEAAQAPPQPDPVDKAVQADLQKTQMQEQGDTQREAMTQAGQDRRKAMDIAADQEARAVDTVVKLATEATRQ